MSPPVDLARALQPRLPSPLQEVQDEGFARHGVRLFLKRDDLVHPGLPGIRSGPCPRPRLRARPAFGFGQAE
ncbi:hypothetical protein B5180_32030 [Streptomyces sp. BF-3]|nr:hypothetical protein B5180_32030 [Streptomyces sp. BF-3]